jgi:hypothetical protein
VVRSVYTLTLHLLSDSQCDKHIDTAVLSLSCLTHACFATRVLRSSWTMSHLFKYLNTMAHPRYSPRWQNTAMASRDASPALSRSPGVATTMGPRAATPSPSSTNNGHTISSVTLGLDFYETITKPWFSSTQFQLRTAKDPKSTQGHDPTPTTDQAPSPDTSTTNEAPSPNTSSLLPIPPTTIISDAIVTSIVTGTNGIALGHASSEYTSMTTYTTVIARCASDTMINVCN